MHTPYEIKIKHKADFRIKYRFYTPKDVDVERVRRPGYKCNFWYGEERPGRTYIIIPEFEDHNGDVILDAESSLNVEGTARMWIAFPDARERHIDNIHVGLKCFLMEGPHKIAECEVIEILDLKINPRNPSFTRLRPSKLLKHQAHRPWPLPEKNWQWYQEWNDTVFIHGTVDAQLLQPYLPEGIQLDLCEGKAWLSVVVFKMEGVRHRFTPAFSPVSDFYEINIRTYVTNGKMPGVLFLSMEGAKWLSSWVAKNFSGLPYVFNRMRCGDGCFDSKGIAYKYKPGNAAKWDETTNWLTERYAVYFSKNGKTCRYQVHHNCWPLQEVEISELNINYPLLQKLNWKPELFHYSPGVQVLTWPVEKL